MRCFCQNDKDSLRKGSQSGVALGLLSRTLWDSLGRSGTFWGAPRTVWDALGRSGTLRDALGRSGTLWGALGRSGTLWDALGRSGTLWGALGHSGALWNALGRSGAALGLAGSRQAIGERFLGVSPRALFLSPSHRGASPALSVP